MFFNLTAFLGGNNCPKPLKNESGNSIARAGNQGNGEWI
jgi:hypothetical protein